MEEYIVERENQGVKQEIKRFSCKEDAIDFGLRQDDQKINIYHIKLTTTLEMINTDEE